MSYLSVPCPRCGGLVQNLKCKTCGTTWPDEKQVLWDGKLECSRRCLIIIDNVKEWEDMTSFWEMNDKYRRYHTALERHERR